MGEEKLQVIKSTLPPIDNKIKSAAEEYLAEHPIEQTTIDKLCPSFTESDSFVTCEPAEGYPLSVITNIEPIQNGTPSIETPCPITGSSKVSLRHCGKNLWNGAQNLTCTRGTLCNIAVPLPAGTYRFSASSFECDATEGELAPAVIPVLADGTSSSTVWRLRNNTLEKSITVDQPIKAIRMYSNGYSVNSSEGVTSTIYDFQITRSSTAVDYEPYRGNEFTVDLGQTVYHGNLDWNTGVLTIDCTKITFTGDEVFERVTGTPNPNGTIFVEYTASAQLKNYGGLGASYFKTVFGISSHFTKANSGYAADVPLNSFYWSHKDSRLRVCYGLPDNGSVANDLKAFLAAEYAKGTPVEFVCELETPIVVQLTPQEILALADTNILFSSTGDTSVTGRERLDAVIEKLTNAIIALGGNV